MEAGFAIGAGAPPVQSNLRRYLPQIDKGQFRLAQLVPGAIYGMVRSA
jgi:hypothetical protein